MQLGAIYKIPEIEEICYATPNGMAAYVMSDFKTYLCTYEFYCTLDPNNLFGPSYLLTDIFVEEEDV